MARRMRMIEAGPTERKHPACGRLGPNKRSDVRPGAWLTRPTPVGGIEVTWPNQQPPDHPATLLQPRGYVS